MIAEAVAAEELIDELFRGGAFQFKPEGWNFTYHADHPDAPRSTIKVQLRTPENGGTVPVGLIRKAGYFMAQQVLLDEDTSHVIGIPNAGNPLAEGFVEGYLAHHQRRLTLAKIRKEERDGIRHFVGFEGVPPPKGTPTGILDDTMTGRGNKIKVIDFARQQDYQLGVRQVLIFILRPESPANSLLHLGVRVGHAITLQHDVLPCLRQRELITQAELEQAISSSAALAEHIRRNS
jgi:hypothetical protein